ncbi:MAG TPA: hypothetical protein VFV99_05500 [Kofleriaceae bacterium]|nr:hypothetical protein [Kofleriaceae bacterium]
MKWLVLAIAFVAACKKQEAAPKQQRVTPMPAAEIQRSQDACKTYVERICACAERAPANGTGSPGGSLAPDVAKQCELARALPEAVRIGLEVAASPDSQPDIVQQSYASVRKTAKECIEQTAKLPALGCQ